MRQLLLLTGILLCTSLFAREGVPPLEVRRVIIDIDEAQSIGYKKNSDPGEEINKSIYPTTYNATFRQSSSFYEENFKHMFEEVLVDFGYDVAGYGNIFKEKRNFQSPRYALAFKIDSLVFNYSGPSNGYTDKFHSYIRVKSQILDLSNNEIVYNNTELSEYYTEKSGNHIQSSDYNNYFNGMVEHFVKTLTERDAFQTLIEESKIDSAGNINSDTLVVAQTREALEKPAELQNAIKSTVTIMPGGSGAVISPRGHILTCQHVVQGNKEVEVILSNGMKVKARVLRMNAKYDVALLQMDGFDTKPIRIQSTGMPKPATEAWAIGTPQFEDLGQSISRGVVSGIRTIDDNQYIQTDASVSPGNSGGPLLNKNGELIGLINAKIVGGGTEGVAFAIPVGRALEKMNVVVE